MTADEKLDILAISKDIIRFGDNKKYYAVPTKGISPKTKDTKDIYEVYELQTDSSEDEIIEDGVGDEIRVVKNCAVISLKNTSVTLITPSETLLIASNYSYYKIHTSEDVIIIELIKQYTGSKVQVYIIDAEDGHKISELKSNRVLEVRFADKDKTKMVIGIENWGRLYRLDGKKLVSIDKELKQKYKIVYKDTPVVRYDANYIVLTNDNRWISCNMYGEEIKYLDEQEVIDKINRKGNGGFIKGRKAFRTIRESKEKGTIKTES